jgi:hypothetical protein
MESLLLMLVEKEPVEICAGANAAGESVLFHTVDVRSGLFNSRKSE